jgi:predicted RNA binding protein YcfA (HicA-like mRNA interferase family)
VLKHRGKHASRQEPTVKVRDAIKLIGDDGWIQVATRGSHRQFKHRKYAALLQFQVSVKPPGLISTVHCENRLRFIVPARAARYSFNNLVYCVQAWLQLAPVNHCMCAAFLAPHTWRANMHQLMNTKRILGELCLAVSRAGERSQGTTVRLIFPSRDDSVSTGGE